MKQTIIRRNKIASFLVFALLISFSLFSNNFNHKALASGSGVISVSPTSGSHKVGENFDVTVAVNGGGQSFMAFAANVVLNNLTVVSVNNVFDSSLWTPPPGHSTSECTSDGDCKPRAGGFLGFSTGTFTNAWSNVTVYNMTVQGDSAGTATIEITDGTIISKTNSDSTTDLFGSAQGGSYTITADTTGGGTTGGGTTTKPTCTDGKKNGTETGVDCGGSCKACRVVAKSTTKSTASASTSTTPTATTTPSTSILDQLKSASSEDDFTPIWQGVSTTNSFTMEVAPPSTVDTTDTDAISGVVFSGKALPGTTVNLFVYSTQLYKSVVAADDYTWKITVDEPIASGNHNVYAYLVDKDSGNSYRASAPMAIAVDSVNNSVKQGSVTVSTPTTTEPTTTTKKDYSKYLLLGGIFIGILLALLLIVILIRRKKKNSLDLSDLNINQNIEQSPSSSSPFDELTNMPSGLNNPNNQEVNNQESVPASSIPEQEAPQVNQPVIESQNISVPDVQQPEETKPVENIDQTPEQKTSQPEPPENVDNQFPRQ